MTKKEKAFANIKYLIEEFRKVEKKEVYDDFLYVHGDYDELFQELACFIETYVLNKEK